MLPLAAKAAAAARPDAQQQLHELAVFCCMLLPCKVAVLAAVVDKRCYLRPVHTCDTMQHNT
jgi:hypothetical protein